MNIKTIENLQTEEIKQAKEITTILDIPLLSSQGGHIEAFDEYIANQLKSVTSVK